MFRNFLKNRRPIFCLLAIVCVLYSGVAMARTAGLSVRTDNSKTADRIIFQWNKMVGYTASRTGDRVTLTFEAGIDGSASLPNAANLKNITEITFAERTNTQTVVTMTLLPGADIRDSRVVRSIVIDASGGTAPAPAPAQEPTAQNDTAPDTNAAPVEASGNVPPAPAPRPDDLAENEDNEGPATSAAPPARVDPPVEREEAQMDPDAAEIVAAVEAAQNSAPDSRPEDAATDADTADDVTAISENLPDEILVDARPTAPRTPAPKEPTLITISTIEPTPLGVFERYDALWLVLGSELGTIEPERFGPLSDVLGDPQTLPLDGGIAYRYQRPENANVAVSKRNLSWQISLSADPAPTLGARYPDVTYDNNGFASIFVPFTDPGQVYALQDPVVGDTIYVVPTGSAAQSTAVYSETPDVSLLPTHLGFAAVEKSDNLKIDTDNGRVIISAVNGLNVSPAALRTPAAQAFTPPTADSDDTERLFNLGVWRRGGIDRFHENRLEMVERVRNAANDEQRVNALFDMALLHFANGFGAEAMGILDMVEDADPETAKTLSFLAIRGASKALAGRYGEAVDDLGTAALQNQPEAKIWRGFAAAGAERWSLAEQLFPESTRILNNYPDALATPMILYMAESALRNGNPPRAAALLENLDNYQDELPVRHRAARLYLQGEMYRQNGQPEKALQQWESAMRYRDRLYRAKSRLATALLQWQEDIITPEQALEDLEAMRFAWRDDAIETQILHSIGLLRVLNGRYYDGLVQLKNAIRLAESRREDTEILSRDMLRIFRNLFVEGKVSEIPPLEAISIYNEFQELMPGGEDAVTAAANFTDQLVDMDLLGRAAETLEGVLQNGSVSGMDVTRIGARLASIYLLDNRANDAISILQRTNRPDTPASLDAERQLLRARALSQLDMVEEAIQALNGLNTPDAARLRADIFWRAGQWDDAATSLRLTLPSPDSAEITPEQAAMVLNTAVALKLANNTQSLANFKEDYTRLMATSALANSFAIVTRPAGRTTLSDRETMLNIAGEVDLFRGFLDGYRTDTDAE